MALIFINRDRQNLGQFTEQEVADGLKSGKFRPDDLAWQEPMEAWKALSTFSHLPPPSEDSDPVLAPGGEAPVRIEPAWERGSDTVFSLLLETVTSIVSRPAEIFRHMPVEGGYAKPLKFYVLIGWLTGLVSLVYQAAVAAVNPEMAFGEHAKSMSFPMMVAFFVGMALFLPLILAAGSFVSAGILHAALAVFGGARKPFQATYRALAYSYGAVSVAQIVPLFGGTIYMVLSLIYSVIALKETHGTDLWRPIAAIVTVLLLCCGLGIGIVALVVGAGVAAGGALQPG